MDRNIFSDFENNKQYTTELLDGIASAVSLFIVADELKFLHFNRAADELFGYKKGGLLAATQNEPLSLFHPDYVDRFYGEIIATMRDGRLFNYDCQILCQDKTYKWVNLSAELIHQKDGGRLCFYCVLSPIETPRDTILKGQHFLISAGKESDRRILSDLIELMGGTCDLTGGGLEAFDFYSSADHGSYQAIFIGSRLNSMNGFELAKEIRHSEQPDAEAIPLILLLSEDDQEVIAAAEEIGINLFINKPLEEKQLYPLLTQISKMTKLNS